MDIRDLILILNQEKKRLRVWDADSKRMKSVDFSCTNDECVQINVEEWEEDAEPKKRLQDEVHAKLLNAYNHFREEGYISRHILLEMRDWINELL